MIASFWYQEYGTTASVCLFVCIHGLKQAYSIAGASVYGKAYDLTLILKVREYDSCSDVNWFSHGLKLPFQ